MMRQSEDLTSSKKLQPPQKVDRGCKLDIQWCLSTSRQARHDYNKFTAACVILITETCGEVGKNVIILGFCTLVTFVLPPCYSGGGGIINSACTALDEI